MKLEGTVDNISSKERRWNDKKTGQPKSGYVYSMQVSGQWVDLGFTKPTYEEGEYVSLEVNQNRWGKYELVKGANGTMANQTTQVPFSPQPQTAPGLNLTKDMAIIRQNALTNAVNFAGTHGKGWSTEDVIATAYIFAEFSSGKREERIAKEQMENENDCYSTC